MEEYFFTLFRYLEQFELLRFLGVSGVSGVVFAAVYFPLQWFTHVHYKRSLYIAFVPSLFVGFVLHKSWTFYGSGTEQVWLQMVLYTIKRLVFIRINEYLLVYLVEHRGFNASYGQATIAIVGFGINYLVTKLIFSL